MDIETANDDLVPDDPVDGTDDDRFDDPAGHYDDPSLEVVELREDALRDEVFVVQFQASYYDDNFWHDLETRIDSVWGSEAAANDRAEHIGRWTPDGDVNIEIVRIDGDGPTNFEHDAVWSVYRLDERFGYEDSDPAVVVVLDSVHPTRSAAESRVEELGPMHTSDAFREHIAHRAADDGDVPFTWTAAPNLDGTTYAVDGDAILTARDDYRVSLSQRIDQGSTIAGDTPRWQEGSVDQHGFTEYSIYSITLSELEMLDAAVVVVTPVRDTYDPSETVSPY